MVVIRQFVGALNNSNLSYALLAEFLYRLVNQGNCVDAENNSLALRQRHLNDGCSNQGFTPAGREF